MHAFRTRHIHLKLNWLNINNKPKGKIKVCKAKVREGEVLNCSNQLLGFAVLPPNSPARVHAVRLKFKYTNEIYRLLVFDTYS